MAQSTANAFVSHKAGSVALELVQTPLELVLDQLEEEWDPKTISQGGAYQTEVLLRWSEYHHRQY